MTERKIIPIAAVTSAVLVLLCLVLFQLQSSARKEKDTILVGLICDGDQSTPYSENFIQALSQVQAAYGERMQCDIRCNITADNCANVLDELVSEGADLIITNSYGFGEAAKDAAGKNPKVQFVQATQTNANTAPVYANYHTFMGRIYEGRYIAGQVAGRKLAQLVRQGRIDQDAAVIGYVGAYESPEVISGFTAFYLGAKDQCPSVTMRVRYTDTWTSYQKEYDTARKLIDEGCVLISQHSDTTGPAVACADASEEHTVYHVGYNTGMISIAPATTLISTKIEWTPYLMAAAEAVFAGQPIESRLHCDIHGNDAGGGFDGGWVRMLPLNQTIAARGTQDMIDRSIEGFKEGKIEVFKGDYTGTDPTDPTDTIDIRAGFTENQNQSAPSFHYILDGITTER